MRSPFKVNFLWLLLLIGFILTYRVLSEQQRESRELQWGELVQLIGDTPQTNQLKSLAVQGQRVEATFKDSARHNRSEDAKAARERGGEQAPAPRKTVVVVGPHEGLGERLRERLEALDAQDEGFEFSYKPEEQESFLQALLLSWLPMIVLLFVFFFFMRQLQGNSGRAMSFGKSRARLLNENQKKVTFADVAGVEEAKEELKEVVEFLKNPQKFTRLGGRIPKGVLLMGPPGTGKTLLARSVAGEAEVPFYSISGSDFVEMFVGVGASRVRDLFEQAKKSAPCIIFIDEIDAVGRQRGAGLGGGHDEREQTLNQLLVEMDGFEHNEGVILIAATNRPDVLDPALLRPGRFDRRVVVSRPDVRGREQILTVHTAKVPLAGDFDLLTLAKGTPGFSGADLENLVNEAALQAARNNQEQVTHLDFEQAKDKVLMGAERKSMIVSEHERRTTAYHEAGHALVALLLPGTDPVHKVTIIPRGRALGVTQQLPSEDRLSMTKDFAEKRIAILMGGRIAEELIFHQVTTGAGQDIEMATSTARSMVCEWGMSEKLGPLAYGSKDEEVFLGRGGPGAKNYSEETAREIDAEIRRIVREGYDRARALISENLDKLEALSLALLERETLEADDVRRLARGESLAPLAARDAKAAPPKPPAAPAAPAATAAPVDQLLAGALRDTVSALLRP
ncbi:MAG: ATP-dependent zinc metalloprotease FtsH, partial [Deltaproteobacteria bacterium]|nr:ATP-dependent zinc metalloprotease FtsH [Deltaproteobacteria bacterium]